MSTPAPRFGSAPRWIAVVLWMGIIFLGSTDLGSGLHTSHFIVPILRWLFANRLSGQTIDDIHLGIRKTWHLLEYAILGVLLWRALASRAWLNTSNAPESRPGVRFVAAAILLAALYAASDEFHQSFVPSRTASVHDVALDTLGASLGVGAAVAWTHRRFKRSAARLRPDTA